MFQIPKATRDICRSVGAASVIVSSSCNRPFKVKTTSVGALSNSSITSTRPCSMAFTLAGQAGWWCIDLQNSPSWNIRPSIFLCLAHFNVGPFLESYPLTEHGLSIIRDVVWCGCGVGVIYPMVQKADLRDLRDEGGTCDDWEQLLNRICWNHDLEMQFQNEIRLRSSKFARTPVLHSFVRNQ